MPTRPSKSHPKVSVRIDKSLRSTHINRLQHGCLLLDLPLESLTHVTSHLPLPSLLALARTCKRLCEHVDDDNTWLRAFLTQFLGINPEHEFDDQQFLLLRRTEPTWRKEFIHRYTTDRRWTRSCQSTLTYAMGLPIDGVHLMSEGALLTPSIQQGNVACSIPFNGKVLKGYISSSPSSFGIEVPFDELAPNVTVCAMTSDGGTARVFWGKRNGEVALTVAKHILNSRAASNFIRCAVDDQHEGAVQHLVPDSGSNTFFSAAADGRIKLWNTKTFRLLWSTDKQQVSLVTDPFVSIAGSLSDGFVAGALRSGDILIYDLHESENLTNGSLVHSAHQLRIPPPVDHGRPQLTERGNNPFPEQQISKLWLHRAGESTVILLIQYTQHSLFYRVHADIHSHDVTITAFGDSSFGNITAIEPVFSPNPQDNVMVITGDLLGFVSIYDTGATPVSPIYRFEAHGDAVTAISYTPTVFATGTATGSTIVWESITLEPMRCFSTPAPRPALGRDLDPVSQILLEKEQLIVIVGKHVLACRVGPASGREHQHKRPKHANTKLNVTTKGHRQYEMDKDIAESYMELEYERAHTRRIYGCEREQRSTLDKLGLSELEAIEYVLMLSREEEEARQQRMVVDEGVFEGDFDDLPSTPASFQSGSNPSTLLSPLYPSWSYHSNARQYPRISLPISNEKVQVSPRFASEQMETGTSASPIRSLAMEPGAQPSPMLRSTSSSSLDHFPSLSSSLSSTSSSRRGRGDGSEQPRSAWSAPLTPLSSLPGPLSPRSRAIAPVVARTRSSNASLLSADIVRYRKSSQVKVPDVEGVDDDLRLAIELSLAESRSKGDGI